MNLNLHVRWTNGTKGSRAIVLHARENQRINSAWEELTFFFTVAEPEIGIRSKNFDIYGLNVAHMFSFFKVHSLHLEL